MFCVTSTLFISWQHLNHPKLLVLSVYKFHVYFHVRIIVHHLVIPLLHGDGFNMIENSYNKVYITVFGIIMVLVWLKCGWMVICFICWCVMFLVMV